jgi:hypothetical protein
MFDRIRRFLGRRKWEIHGDKEHIEWMDRVASCAPPFSSFSVLKDGLAIHWTSGNWLVVQGPERVAEAVQKGNARCRLNRPHCALSTITGLSCYQIMAQAYERRGEHA